MKKRRYNYRPEEKVKILKEHLVEQVAVSDISLKTVVIRRDSPLLADSARVM